MIDAYFLGTKVVVHTYHTTLHYFIAKKKAKPRFIRCILILKEIDFEVKEEKDVKIKWWTFCLVFKSDEVYQNEFDINEESPDELVMAMLKKGVPSYAYYANFIVCGALS